MNRKTEIEFTSNGTSLSATLYYPDGFTKSNLSPLVVMATGDGINGSQSSTWPPLISSILAINIPVFIFDFYSLGKSDGDIIGFNTTTAINNMKDAINVLTGIDWIDRGRIGLIASSFGGAVSLLVQAELSPFKVMCLKSPVSFIPESYETEVNDNLDHWKRNGKVDGVKFTYQAYMDSARYNVYAAAMTIDVPTLIVHGCSDTIVPLKQSIRLNCLMPNSSLVKLDGVNHGYKEPGALDNLIKQHQNFIQTQL